MRSDNLSIALLKEKIERTTGKKVVLKESISDLKKGDKVAQFMSRFNPQLGTYYVFREVTVTQVRPGSVSCDDYNIYEKSTGNRKNKQQSGYGSASYSIMSIEDAKRKFRELKDAGESVRGMEQLFSESRRSVDSIIKSLLKEDETFLNKTQEVERAQHLQDTEANIIANEPHGDERGLAHRKLHNLIVRFDRDRERLETAKKPFLEQIDLIQRQLSAIEGEVPVRLQEQEQEIMDIMAELDITTKKVGGITVQLEQTAGRKNVKYKEIVTGIEKFTMFLEEYEVAYKDLVAKHTSFGEIRKSLMLQKESYMMKENMFRNLFKVIGNIFSSITRSFRKAILSGNTAANALQRLV